MRTAYRAEAIRAADEATGLLESGVLMQRAAAAVATETLRLLRGGLGSVRGRRVLLAVGPGDNGRDGLFAAERLRERGVRVVEWQALREPPAAAIALLPQTDLVVDAVFGLGARPGLPGGVAEFARACSDEGVPVLAVDLPSGVSADSCAVGESFHADVTVTFGALRLAHVLEPAMSRCGRIVVADIGLGLADAGGPSTSSGTVVQPVSFPEPVAPFPELVEGPGSFPEPVEGSLQCWDAADVAAHLPIPDATSSKYTRGVVGMDTGSDAYIGAGILSATGAVYAGAGMVRFVGPKPGPVRLALPSIVTGRGRVQSWLLGSGWGARADAAQIIEACLAEGVPTVLDADAIQPTLPRLRPDVLLTPHAGELARLLGVERGQVEADPLGAVTAAVERTGATILLKGASQIVHGPDFPCTRALPGPAWTAQAGSGDVLAGMCATYLAAGLSAPDAALTAASMQALAAERCWGPTPPHDVAREIPGVVRDLLR